MMIEINKKRILSILFITAMLMSFIPLLHNSKAYAEDEVDWKSYLNGEDHFSFWDGWLSAGSMGDIAYRIKYKDDGTLLEEFYGIGEYEGGGIRPAQGENMEIVIGGEITGIADDAFSSTYEPNYSTCLKKVTLSDNITTIGNRAFYNCKSLSSVNMPNSLTQIGDSAFSGCSSLGDIVFPSRLQYIGNGAFSGCSRLTAITTPASMRSVSDSAFSGCTGLTSVAFYGNNAVIGSCINNCPNIKTLTVGNGVQSISTIYNDFAQLETISLNTNTSYFMNGGLFISDKTTATKVIYTGTGTIKDLNFTYQPKLKTVVIENGVKGIGERAFCYWEQVEKITVPSSVQTVGTEAFMNCKKLKSLTIGAGVTKLGKDMVYGCKKLKTVTIKTKKLKKKTVKKCLSDSKVKTVKVKIGSKSTNKKYIKKYKKIFTKKNVGKKVKVK